jgi:hypothetical protein
MCVCDDLCVFDDLLVCVCNDLCVFVCEYVMGMYMFHGCFVCVISIVVCDVLDV